MAFFSNDGRLRFRNPFGIPVAKCEARSGPTAMKQSPYRVLSAAATPDEVPYGSGKYYALCGVGGILSCGITHTAVTPLDLVKCRIQTNPAKYGSIFKGFRVTLQEDGARGLLRGWAPTCIGYSLQGLGMLLQFFSCIIIISNI